MSNPVPLPCAIGMESRRYGDFFMAIWRVIHLIALCLLQICSIDWRGN